ncbi:S24 family peptidase [Delftia tsuruhatensis]|uniref:S24 family peptidase n=1 Tax=Delftia tsuruhatensis TaxID=180282 RepID=UPI002091DF37|nr:S24 family peptidase [Delftia tsuruhatensis]MCO5338275.1 S24 family peptidase [Delftia tsuruhatensis]MCR4545673.1 S24 family peptidase [Delftia tsuruhatensis]
METGSERRKRKLKMLADAVPGGIKAVADRAGMNYQTLTQVLAGTLLPPKKDGSQSPRSLGDKAAERIEDEWRLRRGWFDNDAPLPPHLGGPDQAANAIETELTLHEEGEDGVETLSIEYWDVRGSCGGGSNNWESRLKGRLAKERTWFERYGVRPKDAMAIMADGDSMADFIVDGDIVIFDRTKTSPRSGAIFLIQHPDGLKIKQLRRGIDGSWVLESRNTNKSRFPDERIPPESSDLLAIKGEFVYRQGGI